MRAIVSAAALAVLGGMAMAQTIDATASHDAWSVYQSGSGASRVCWAAATPKESTAKRGGKSVQVRRGDIAINVAIRPGAGVKSEISVVMGYPLKNGSEVDLSIGSAKFSLFTDGETAWTRPADDDAVIKAFRRGSEARAVGMSSRGTTTIDRYSLIGVSAALDAARKLCQ